MAEYLFQSPQKSLCWPKRISDFLRYNSFLPHSHSAPGSYFQESPTTVVNRTCLPPLSHCYLWSHSVVHGENRSTKPSFGSMGLCVVSACVKKRNDAFRTKIESNYLSSSRYFSTSDRSIWIILNAWP